jgi:hypothetical protein
MSWRTNLSLVSTNPQLLAQKLIKVGWAELSETEQQSVRTLCSEVHMQLDAKQRFLAGAEYLTYANTIEERYRPS